MYAFRRIPCMKVLMRPAISAIVRTNDIPGIADSNGSQRIDLLNGSNRQGSSITTIMRQTRVLLEPSFSRIGTSQKNYSISFTREVLQIGSRPSHQHHRAMT